MIDHRMPAVFTLNLFQFKDRFVKHAQLAVAVRAGEVDAEVHVKILRIFPQPLPLHSATMPEFLPQSRRINSRRLLDN